MRTDSIQLARVESSDGLLRRENETSVRNPGSFLTSLKTKNSLQRLTYI
jgi:hypothetical protein